MPLHDHERKRVLEYCDAHLPSDAQVADIFDFLDDEKLRQQIESEYYAARYIYKLGEALGATDERLHAHVKFQIVQYAAIYEAIIVYLLWQKFESHPAVTGIQFHNVFKPAVALPNSISLTTSATNEDIVLCVQAKQRTPAISIKFDDKVNAAVQIGFLDAAIGEDIKRFYKLRNAIHLESAIKNEVKYEIADSQLAYLRIQPFTVGVRAFLQTGALPSAARAQLISPPAAPLQAPASTPAGAPAQP